MEELLKTALVAASKAYRFHLMECPGNYDGAEKAAYTEATNCYISGRGLDNVKPSSLTARWRKLGWWPPLDSYPDHRTEFFQSLKDRVTSEKIWDFPSLQESRSSDRQQALEREELNRKVYEAVSTSNNYSAAVQKLNELGILTSKGKRWTLSLLSYFCKYRFKENPPIPLNPRCKETGKSAKKMFSKPKAECTTATSKDCDNLQLDPENLRLLRKSAEKSGLSLNAKLNKLFLLGLIKEKEIA